MNAGDDPWDWPIDRVVQELCTTNRSWQPRSHLTPLPDPTQLEQALRENEISGDTLLLEVDDKVLRKELGVTSLGRRAYLRNAISELRLMSPRYREYVQKHQPKSDLERSIQELVYNVRQQSVSGYPITPSPQLRSPKTFVPGQLNPPFSLHGLSDPAVPEPPTGKTTRRIAPILVSSELDSSRNRDIPTAADTVKHNDPQNIEPGVVFIGEDGKKRLVPIRQPDSDTQEPFIYDSLLRQPRLTEDGVGTARPKDLAVSGKKVLKKERVRRSKFDSRNSYLGTESMPVDNIFYGTVALGEEMPDSENDEEFHESQPIANGKRLYVHSVMKSYLRSSRQGFTRQGSVCHGVKPYSEKLIPRFNQPSFTLYHADKKGKIHSYRQHVSSFPELNGGPSIHTFESTVDDHGATFNPPGPEMLHGDGSSYDNWDPSFLEKYNHLEGGDDVLPLYGESDSENEYDMATWKEMEDERGERLDGLSRPTKGTQLTKDEVNEAIDHTIDQLVIKWQSRVLPKRQERAWILWTKSRKRGTKRAQILAAQKDQETYSQRIQKIRNEILSEIWPNKHRVYKQSQILETNVFAQEDLNWKIATLEQKVTPKKPLTIPSVAAPKKPDDNLMDDGEEGESIESESYASSSEDGLDGFIENDGEFDPSLEVYEDHADEYASMSDQGVSSPEPFAPELFSAPSKSKRHGLLLSPEDARSSSSSVTIKHELVAMPRKTPTPAGQHSEIIDLTISSDEATSRNQRKNYLIDLVTPEKKKSKAKVIKQIISIDSSGKSDDFDSENEEVILSSKRRRSVGTTSSEDDLIEADTPHKKRRRRVIQEDAVARDMREQDHIRLAEQELRRKELHARLEMDGGADNDLIIINDAKKDDQGYVYVYPAIAKRIKKHQIDGIRFLWNKVVTDGTMAQGCLLAHTMGLGKTMQVITLLVAIAEAAESPDVSISTQIPESLQKSRTLVLCPPTLIDNWMDELLLWAPDNLLGDFRKIDASIKTQNRLSTISRWRKTGGVLIIGYEMFRNLIENKHTAKREPTLNEEEHAQVCADLLEGPNLIIADEAHKMKNASASITIAAHRFASKARIALTGSPLANNVEEYHTMIEWVAPNYLGPIVEFRAKYVLPIESGLFVDSTSYEQRRAYKMLDVLKQDLVLKVHRADMSVLRNELPKKSEFVIKMPLTDLQRDAYSTYVSSVMSGEAQFSRQGEVTQTTLWHWLSILSLLCNHPSCFKAKLGERKEEAQKELIAEGEGQGDTLAATDLEEALALDVNASIWKVGVSQELIDDQTQVFEDVPDLDTVELSNKVQILCQILDAAKAAHDKTLVFSQSIPTLDYLEALCRKQDRKLARLDGKTAMNKRQSHTKDFNSNGAEVYLISTSAGGLGLNLPSANRVVIFDFKFNPIAEEQAVGRAYRIGQLKETFVYRFVIGGTFEDAVLNKTIFKKQLASRVVDKKKPIAYAMRKLGDFLFEPTEVEQADLSEFIGTDPLVLDQILKAQEESGSGIIRSIVQSETFERDDNEKLTAEEEKEVRELIDDEQLKRKDPKGWQELQRRRQFRLVAQATAAAPPYHAALANQATSLPFTFHAPILPPNGIKATDKPSMSDEPETAVDRNPPEVVNVTDKTSASDEPESVADRSPPEVLQAENGPILPPNATEVNDKRPPSKSPKSAKDVIHTEHLEPTDSPTILLQDAQAKVNNKLSTSKSAKLAKDGSPKEPLEQTDNIVNRPQNVQAQDCHSRGRDFLRFSRQSFNGPIHAAAVAMNLMDLDGVFDQSQQTTLNQSSAATRTTTPLQIAPVEKTTTVPRRNLSPIPAASTKSLPAALATEPASTLERVKPLVARTTSSFQSAANSARNGSKGKRPSQKAPKMSHALIEAAKAVGKTKKEAKDLSARIREQLIFVSTGENYTELRTTALELLQKGLEIGKAMFTGKVSVETFARRISTFLEQNPLNSSISVDLDHDTDDEENSTPKSATFQAMNRQPVKSLKTPVVKSSKHKNRNRSSTDMKGKESKERRNG